MKVRPGVVILRVGEERIVDVVDLNGQVFGENLGHQDEAMVPDGGGDQRIDGR